ncbi:MAG TPA: helix-turn-helix transcriptional regulator [Candidatus Pacearchaeota archaeon]|jgi:transcriptional regulator with XRE-family HTH domain|nr:helix-turn-helix domain-containing protein [Bacteroidales bacterium]HOI97945.1 helix-turn-helix transcriptional regulator [Candidatus Pacearchaeota archaeon]
MSKEKSMIGETIRKYRLQKGMSQDKLSKLADVAFHTVVKIESGNTPNPTIDTVKKIAAALDISVDELLK